MDKLEIALPWIITIPVSLLSWLFPDITISCRFFICVLVLLLSLLYVCLKSKRQTRKSSGVLLCSRCVRIVPSKAKVCPYCGNLIRNFSKAAGNKKLINIIITPILVLAVGICVISLSGKFNYDITHKSLGYSISIGMKKTTVDKILGPGHLSGTCYLYFSNEHYDGIIVIYLDGKVECINVSTRQWSTEKGIYVGDGLYDVFGAYGLADITPNEESQNNGYIVSYFLDGCGQVCSTARAKKKISFYFDENMIKINYFSISNISKR